jgi:PAS domain S-box-containing protein
MTVKNSKTRKSNDLPACSKAVLTKSGVNSAAINTSKPTRTEFEQLAEASNDAVRILNRDFTIRYINRAFAEITGVNQDEVIGEKCWEVFPSSLCHTPECRAHRVINGEKRIEVEIGRQKPDGSIIPCIVTTFPLIDDAGNTIGIIEQFRDITEHRQMKEQVRETEDRYKALIELGAEAGEAVIMLQDIDGKEGIQTFFNDQWPKITGYTPKELESMSFFNLLTAKERKASVLRHRLKMAGKVVPGLYEVDIIRKDGVSVPVELTGGYSSYQGYPTNVVYLRDVSERKQAEKTIQKERNKYLQLFEYAPVALWEHDYSAGMPFINSLKSRGITDFNKYFNEHLDELALFNNYIRVINTNQACHTLYATNIESIATVIQRVRNNSINQKVTKEEDIGFLKGMINLIAHLIENRSGILVQEHPLPTITGETRHVRASLCVLPGHEEALSLVYGAGIDIPDRVNAEKELMDYKNHLEEIIKQRNAQLIEAEAHARQSFENEKLLRQRLQEQIDERTQFTRALVHELKTPLTPLLSASEYLAGYLKEDIPQQFAQNIYDGAKKLEKRVEEMMDITRGELGMLQLTFEIDNLQQIIEDTVKYYTPQTAKKEQAIKLIPFNEIPPLKIDSGKIQQVIINLLDNASRFSKRGGEIVVFTRLINDDAVVEIMDKGRGIASELQDDLFKPYKRIGWEKQYGGLGLGWLCVRHLSNYMVEKSGL